MLGNKSSFKEATDLKEKGSITLKLDDEDPTAMMVVLLVIHHKSDRVPTKLTVENLWHVAIIADKYDWAASMDFWVKKSWVPALLPESPRSVTQLDLDWRWLLISYVFHLEKIFERITRSIILQTGLLSENLFGGGTLNYHYSSLYTKSSGVASNSTLQWQAYVPERILGMFTKLLNISAC